MTVETNSLKVGDRLNIFRDQCRPGPRMYLICDKIKIGQAEISSVTDDKHAYFQMKNPTVLKDGDYLEGK
jgi:hypothetical protein